ncbi:type IV pilin [Halorubrum sp. CBA1125]|uniref:PKD domain-containing protein n=1 Tax=Halorubrum sp. CBA1125 TaxID=2668072 RepID=UPI0012E734A8|nr:type IV pilin [Halorubrum sp. CBA1125]MUW14458.1 type IV pilin [Halorubrum sp. CBA1125]
MTNRAVTEPIGVILLVAVVVVASVTLGTGILLQTSAIQDRTDSTRLNVKTEVTESTVTVRHVGGPDFETGDVRLLLRGDADRVGPYTLDATEVDGAGLGDGTFDVGDEATLNHSFTGYVEVLLFDTESGDQLYRTLRSAAPEEPDPPAPENEPPTAVASSLDQVAEGYSITLDGSDSVDTDGSIVSYSWTIASGAGSISEDDTGTPNATYSAPADVTGDQPVTVELTVTDDDGATDTATRTVTVVDTDTAQPPEDGNGDGSAFDDPNGNGVYDPGEVVISKEDLEDGFDDPDVDLVIYPEVGTVTASGDPVDITAKTITAGSDFRANGDTIRLTATGDIRIDGVTLDANSNDGITITSTDGRIFANESTMTANNGAIALDSNGDIYLVSASLDGGGYNADLGTPTATLHVDQLSLAGQGNNPGILEYDPNDATVNGTPAEGTVAP